MNKKVMVFSLWLSITFCAPFVVFAHTSNDVVGHVEPTLNTTEVPASQVNSIQVTSTTVNGDVDTAQTSTCVDLQSASLRYRASDASTNGEVSVLQDFLLSVSILKSQVTGYFGLNTFSAVKQFQKKVGLVPTGYVGLLTKAKVKDISCNGLEVAAPQQISEGQIKQKELPKTSSGERLEVSGVSRLVVASTSVLSKIPFSTGTASVKLKTTGDVACYFQGEGKPPYCGPCGVNEYCGPIIR